MSAAKIRFGFTNITRRATLASDPTPLTSIENIKNELGSRMAIWPDPNDEGNIVITGSFDTPQNAQFIAFPSVNRIGDVEFKMEAYLAPDVNQDILNMPWTAAVRNDFGGLIPLGEWAVGVDPYGVPTDAEAGTLPDTFTHYFDERIYFDSFRLTIRRSSSSSDPLKDIRMRMFFMGDMIELDHTFSYGNLISFLGEPQLRQTRGGSWIPTQRQNRSRRIRLSLDMMSDKDRNAMYQLESTLLGDPFIVTAFPDSQLSWQYNNYNMLARFGNAVQYDHRYIGIHSADITFLEV